MTPQFKMSNLIILIVLLTLFCYETVSTVSQQKQFHKNLRKPNHRPSPHPALHPALPVIDLRPDVRLINLLNGVRTKSSTQFFLRGFIRYQSSQRRRIGERGKDHAASRGSRVLPSIQATDVSNK